MKHKTSELTGALLDVVTFEAETKAEFIARVCKVLSEDPDERSAQSENE